MTRLEEQALSVTNSHIIERPRLTRLLDETTARVILLVAPAGYGKTVLAQQWLAARPHAFYRATESTADIAVVGTGLLAAGTKLTQHLGDRFAQWLRGRRGTGSSDVAAELLAEDFQGWPNGAWLAIDDYHLLAGDAERLIETLRSVSSFRLLITTRRRPDWCRSRDLLYGDIFELGIEHLAMNRQEASGVLTALGDEAGDIIDLADGWPAVIGLAAFAPHRPVPHGGGLPPALHNYIAEELYSSLSAATRDGLFQLSLLSNPSHASARRILGAGAERVLREGRNVGFLTDYQPAAFTVHPLLREFLHQKLLIETHEQTRLPLLKKTLRFLEEEQRWENAFEVIRRFELDHLLPELIATALYDLLDRGMLDVLGEFVREGKRRLGNSPVLDLAAAELAFREGFHARSLALAQSAAQGLSEKTDLSSRAYCRAGHAAYFLDHIGAAASNFKQARGTARTDADKRKAIWGQFLAALDSESDEAVALLSEFEAASGSDADDVLRIQNGRLHLGMRLGSVTIGLRGAEAVADMVDEARDPVARASFWHVYSGALRLAARYDDALAASERTEYEIRRFDLSFAQAYVQLTRSLMHMGLSAYDDARATLDDAAAIGSRTGDVFIQLSERVNRCRLLLLVGKDNEAAECTSGAWPSNVTAGLLGEFHACAALAAARSNPTGITDGRLASVEETTRENEARALAACARAVIALDEAPSEVSSIIGKSFQSAVSRGVLDPFVFAFKLDQRLPRLVQRQPGLRFALDDLRPFIGSSISRSIERPLDAPETIDALTPRETEVLDLLAAGLTNAEIASTLFLAAPTVKVHVRSVLRKLGLRTRTEAAVYAVTRRRPGAEESPRQLPAERDTQE